ncbi:uncharacterized protein METZ01_LOCUS166567, partial [marine metagenome]
LGRSASRHRRWHRLRYTGRAISGVLRIRQLRGTTDIRQSRAPVL